MNAYTFYQWLQPIFRKNRWSHFRSLFPLSADLHVLDVGGHVTEWMAYVDAPSRVTIVNLSPWPESLKVPDRFVFCQGNASDLPFPDQTFSIGYSNSVIEHMGTYAGQVRFASEISRVAKCLYVQTPNRWFPVEPHFLALFAHWLPKRFRDTLLPWLSVRGWFRSGDDVSPSDLLHELRLLDARELQKLFPDCVIYRERFLGFTKSLIAYRQIPL